MRTVIAGLLAAVALHRATAQARADTTFAAVERAASADMAKLGIPGISVAFVDSGRIVYARAFGFANVEARQPLTSDMLFRLGSVSKIFTSLAAVAEARARGISLDAPIGRYWPGLHPAVARVTLGQLISYSAGVIDEVTATPIADRPNEDELVRQIPTWTDTMFLAEPGEIFSYSNLSFVLAGAFLEAVSHKRFNEIVRERVLVPLGLRDATFLQDVAVTYPFSQGHMGAPGTPAVVDRPLLMDARHLPATFLWASASDLARLEIALMDHGRIDGRQALDSAVVDIVTATHAVKPLDARDQFAYGLFVFDDGRQRLYSYLGRSEGYQSFINMAPASHRGFVVLGNRHDVIPAQTANALRALAIDGVDPRVRVPTAPSGASQVATTVPRDVAGHYSNGTWSFDIRETPEGLEFRGLTSPTQPAPVVARVVADGADRIALARTIVATGQTTYVPVAVIRDGTGRVKLLFLGNHAARRRPP